MPSASSVPRRDRRLLAAAAGLAAWATIGAGPAGGHPAHGTKQVTVRGDLQTYEPESVTIWDGDSVGWKWQGGAGDHSVTADAGQRERFDSDPDGPPAVGTHPDGDGFTHLFTKPGTYTYYCRTYPTMQGEVVVRALPGSRPRIRNLRVRATSARFRLSKRADVVGRIESRRSGDWRIVKSFARRGRRGRNRIDLPTGSLEAGRYRLSLMAYDLWTRRSRVHRERFSLR